MILRYCPLEFEIQLQPGAVCTIALESPTVLYKVFSELYKQQNGDADAFILIKNDSAIPFPKAIQVICSPGDLQFANAAIKKALYQKLSQELLESGFQDRLSNVNEQIDAILEEFKLTCGYEIGYCLPEGPKDVLDAYDISLAPLEGTLTEKLVSYITTITRLFGKSLFICCNFGDYLSFEDVELLKKDIAYLGVSLLFMTGHRPDSLKGTETYIVDKDLCLIY